MNDDPPVAVRRRARNALLVLLSLGAACAGNELESQVQDVGRLIRNARKNGAYNCAPRQLAMAEAHNEFAERELDQGDYFRAQSHLQIADENARDALRLSPRQKCVDGKASAAAANGGGPDADGDGVTHPLDRCPSEREDKDGFEDQDGCADPDNDQDGRPDSADRCPSQAEDADGFKDQDGCPEPDNDEDGVADALDSCPNEAEDRDEYEDENGCPDPDNDSDSVLDSDDKCPLEPASKASHGCPPRFTHIAPESVHIALKQPVIFAANGQDVAPISYNLLTEVASFMKDNEAVRIRVEAHTDARGKRKKNIRVSQMRADAVRKFLVSQGVDATRIRTQGYGPDQPIETNRTEAGRQRNQRVEIVITAK